MQILKDMWAAACAFWDTWIVGTCKAICKIIKDIFTKEE